jgi:hypothetical protein
VSLSFKLGIQRGRSVLTAGTTEYAAGAKAAEEEIRFQRERWLPQLESWLQDPRVHVIHRHFLEKDIKRLRRCVGIRNPPLTLEQRRAEVRERVRKHREKRKRFAKSA